MAVAVCALGVIGTTWEVVENWDDGFGCHCAVKKIAVYMWALNKCVKDIGVFTGQAITVKIFPKFVGLYF